MIPPLRTLLLAALFFVFITPLLQVHAASSDPSPLLEKLEAFVAAQPGTPTAHEVAAAFANPANDGITFGDEVTFETEAVFNNPRVVALDASTIVIAYTLSASGTRQVVVGTLSGNAVTFGAPSGFPAQLATTGAFEIAALDPTRLFLSGNSNGWLYAFVGTVSGTTISWGTPDAISVGTVNSFLEVASVDEETAAIAYFVQGGGGAVVSVDVAGTDVTFGTPAPLASIGFQSFFTPLRFEALPLHTGPDAKRVVLGTGNKVAALVLNNDGTITLPANATVSGGRVYGFAPLSSERFVMLYRSGAGFAANYLATVGSIDESGIVTFEAETILTNPTGTNVTIFSSGSLASLGANQFVATYTAGAGANAQQVAIVGAVVDEATDPPLRIELEDPVIPPASIKNRLLVAVNATTFVIGLGGAEGGRILLGTTVSNQPPVADAGPDDTREATGPSTDVTLDGSASSDPDGDALTYTWTDATGAEVATGVSPTLSLAVGTYTFTLTVADPSGERDTDEVVITVEDTTGPVITLLGDAVVTITCEEDYVDAGATATDLVDGVVTVTVSGVVDTGTPGTYTLSYDATDAAGNPADTVTRTVIIEDTTAPVVTAEFIPVSGGGDDDDDDDDEERSFIVQCTATDNCDSDPTLSSVITIPELDNPTLKFKTKDKLKLKFDLEKNKVTVHAPDPEAFWAAVTAAGGVAVTEGQEITFEGEDDDDDEEVIVFKFNKSGNLKTVTSHMVLLRCLAEDASGNQGSAEASLPLRDDDDDDDDDDGDDDGDDDDDEEDDDDRNLKRASTDAVAKATITTAVPDVYTLSQNYPNPFNPLTTIRFGLPESADVRLAVYDVLGREVALLHAGTLSAGWHAMSFDASRMPSGTYLYRLETPQGAQTGRMLLLK